MPVNKVEYCGKVLLDLTEDSVTPENLVEGVTAHGKNGERLVGTNPYAKAETDTVVNEQADLIDQIMAAVDNLPEAGGVELPELDNPASADDIVEGKEAISELGEVVVGTNPYAKAATDMVVDEQSDLIEQIRSAVDSLPEAGGGGESAIKSWNGLIYGASGLGMAGADYTLHYIDAALTHQILYASAGYEYDITIAAGSFITVLGTDSIDPYMSLSYGFVFVPSSNNFELQL